MRKLSFYSSSVAEALIDYVSYSDVYDRFLEVKASENLSIAEYVFKYELLLFNDFCIDNYRFSLSEVRDIKFL